MQTYVILRHRAWATTQDWVEAARSSTEGDRMPDDIRWIRSYVLDGSDGAVGTGCIDKVSTPEAIHEHARHAEMAADEIIALADILVMQPDPESVST